MENPFPKFKTLTLPNFSNHRVPCSDESEIPKLNLNPWKDGGEGGSLESVSAGSEASDEPNLLDRSSGSSDASDESDLSDRSSGSSDESDSSDPRSSGSESSFSFEDLLGPDWDSDSDSDSDSSEGYDRDWRDLARNWARRAQSFRRQGRRFR